MPPAVLLIIKVLQAALVISTVMVKPFGIITSSAEVGTTPPTQVAVLLQFPVAPALMVAAFPWLANNTKQKATRKFRSVRVCFVIIR